MSRRQSNTFTPNLQTFLKKVMTPAVLVGGVVFLIFFNFNSELKTTTVANDHFHGDVAFSHGPFAYRFQEDGGLDRPALSYAGEDLISYSEWGSTASVDGVVQELWNNNHGYEYDTSKDRLYNAISGTGWQLVEIVTLVNDHTVTVTFNFVARPASLPGPSNYVFDIAHVTSTAYQWYNCQVSNNTFTGQIMSGNGVAALRNKPQFYGVLSVAASSAIHKPAVWVKGGTSLVSEKTIVLGQEFFTEYQIDNPTPDHLIALGSETLSFQTSANSPDAPLPLPAQ